MKTELLVIGALNVMFHSKTDPKPLVKKLDLVIPKGKAIRIVGESDSGKGMTMKSVMDLLPDKATDYYAGYTFKGAATADR